LPIAHHDRAVGGREAHRRLGRYFEWWYFHAHLADGAKLVVTFMNKDIAEPQKSLEPYRPSSGLVMSGPARANAPCERMIKTIHHDCLH